MKWAYKERNNNTDCKNALTIVNGFFSLTLDHRLAVIKQKE